MPKACDDIDDAIRAQLRQNPNIGNTELCRAILGMGLSKSMGKVHGRVHAVRGEIQASALAAAAEPSDLPDEFVSAFDRVHACLDELREQARVSLLAVTSMAGKTFAAALEAKSQEAEKSGTELLELISTAEQERDAAHDQSRDLTTRLAKSQDELAVCRSDLDAARANGESAAADMRILSIDLKRLDDVVKAKDQLIAALGAESAQRAEQIETLHAELQKLAIHREELYLTRERAARAEAERDAVERSLKEQVERVRRLEAVLYSGPAGTSTVLHQA